MFVQLSRRSCAVVSLVLAGCYSEPMVSGIEGTSGTEGSSGSDTASTGSAPDGGDDGMDDDSAGDDGDPTTTGMADDTTTGTGTDTGVTECLGATEMLVADLHQVLCSTADLYSCDGAENCSIIACNLGPADPGGWVRQVDPAMGEGIDVSPAVEMGTIAADGSRVTADIVVSVGGVCNPRFVTRAVCGGTKGCDATILVRVFDAGGDFAMPLEELGASAVFDGAATEIDIDLSPFQDVPQLYIELAMYTDAWSTEDVLLFQQPRVLGTD